MADKTALIGVGKMGRGLFSKDVQHAARLAETYGLDLPVTQSTAETAAKLIERWAAEGD